MRGSFGYSNTTGRFNTTVDVESQADALKELAELAQRATCDALVKSVAHLLIAGAIEPGAARTRKTDEAELTAIYTAVKYGDERVAPLRNGVLYTRDPRYADYFQSPVDLLNSCLKGACAGDCLPNSTLLLGAGYNFISGTDVRVGDVVMGDGRWTRVTQKWDKGILPIIEFRLNNGSTLRCTADHKLFVVPKIGGCAGDRAGAIEVRAGDVQLEDDLLVPEQLPVGRESIESERSWLLGTHVADGWCEYDEAGRAYRVAISAQDGWRKEGNKSRAVAFCEREGLASRWHRKYLAINDPALAQWLAPCGRGAKEKHLPSLDFDEATLRSVLEGLNNDADVRDSVFGTVSERLALQLRVLYRMLGQSTHITRVDDHGGFGSNPIYRVTPRAPDDRRRRFARVKAISAGGEEPCFDIEVDGHRFYLPESDTIVHNCDDHTALIVALTGSIGFRCGLRAWGKARSKGFVHVYPVVLFPKLPPYERTVGLDTTVPEASVGWEPPRGNVLTAWLE